MQQGRDQNKTVAQPIAGGVTYQRLLNAKAEPHNWLMYWGDYQGTHYSPLTQITPNNARQLKTGVERSRFSAATQSLEATPLVVDGVMYTTGSGNPATVTAHRRADGTPDLAMDAAAEDRQPVRDQPVRARRRDSRQPPVRRHARRRARRARRANRPAALGSAGRRHDGGLEHHEPAARAERHGHHRHDRRRVRDARPPRRLRRGDREAASGASTPFRRPVSPATTRGKATAGKPAAARHG